MSENELEFIADLSVNNENSLNELSEAMTLVHSIRTLDDITDVDYLQESLALIDLFILSQSNLKPIEIRKILRVVRKLWFLQGVESENLATMYTEFLTSRVESALKDICTENDLEKSDEQMKRCNFLIMLFSYSYDDCAILGICKYDYLFVIILNTMIINLVDRLIVHNKIEADNFYRLVFLMDCMITNWLDIYDKIKKKEQYNMDFLDRLRNNLCTLTNKCKDRYKLISITLGTIVGNIQLLIDKF